jgi:hypothetical protein
VAGREGDRPFMTAWLAGSLTGGDGIVADFRGFTGPGLRWERAAQGGIALAGLVTAIEAGRDFFGPGSGSPGVAGLMLPLLAGAALSVASPLLRKPVYVAVTERQLIVVQMHRRWPPDLVLASSPFGALQVAATDLAGRRTLTVTAAGGSARTPLRVTALGRRGRFDVAVAALIARGGQLTTGTERHAAPREASP